MSAARGQLDIRHAGTAVVTAALIGAGTFIWGLVKPEPKVAQERAIAEALQAREYAEMRKLVDGHEAALRVVMPQLQRIEEAVNELRESRGVRPASGKR